MFVMPDALMQEPVMLDDVKKIGGQTTHCDWATLHPRPLELCQHLAAININDCS